MEKKKKIGKTAIKYTLSIVLLLGIALISLYYLLADNFFEIIDMMANSKAAPVFSMIGCIIASFIVEGTVITIFSKLYRRKYKIYQGVLNGLIGSFFSAITPFASGGQFVQTYTFTKQGVKASNGASILVMMFIVSQTVIVLYGTLALILGYNTTIKNMEAITIFSFSFSPIAISLIGYVINFFSLASLLLLSYCKPLHRFVLSYGINIAHKLHLVKDVQKKRTSLVAQVATFRIELTRLFKNYWVLIITLLLYIVKFTLINSLPYLAGLAFGEDMSGKYFDCLWSYSYVSMITAFVPIPGASGGAEYAFSTIFSSIYSSTVVTNSCNILVRSIAFYFTLIVGMLTFFFYRGSPKKEGVDYYDRKTFVDLQIIALSENSEEVELKEYQEAKEIKETKIQKKLEKSIDNSIDEAQKLLSPSEVKRSFKRIVKSSLLDQKSIYEEEDKYLEQSKKSLANIYNEVKEAEIEKNNQSALDTQVETEIKHDLDRLIDEDKRKEERKARRKEFFDKLFRRGGKR